MDNNAKSCYNRIICKLAMIVSQYFAVSKEAASMQAETLEQMCFRIRTALGDSKKFYKHTRQNQSMGRVKGVAQLRQYGY
jgi:hypothetical protein